MLALGYHGPMQLEGRCGCGAVTYRLEGPTDFAAHCHCASCRGFSGAAFLTWTSVPRERFQLDGAEAVRWHRSSEAILWGFCGTCGTTLFYEADGEGHPEQPRTGAIYVTVGSLQSPLDREAMGHVSYEEHVAWFEPGDGLPRFVGKTDTRYG